MKTKKIILSCMIILMMSITIGHPSISFASNKKDIDVKIENFNPNGIMQTSYVVVTITDKENGKPLKNFGMMKFINTDSRGGIYSGDFKTDESGKYYLYIQGSVIAGITHYLEISFAGNEEYNSFTGGLQELFTYTDQPYETKGANLDMVINDKDGLIISVEDDNNKPVAKCIIEISNKEYMTNENGILKIKEDRLFNNILKIASYPQIIDGKYYNIDYKKNLYIPKLALVNDDVKKGKEFKGQIADADSNLAVINKCISVKLSDGSEKEVGDDGSFTLTSMETSNNDNFTLFANKEQFETPEYPQIPHLGTITLNIISNDVSYAIKEENSQPDNEPDKQEPVIDDSKKDKPKKNNTLKNSNKSKISKDKKSINTPDTSDNSNLAFISSLLILSVIGIGVTLSKVNKAK